ncbi:MAG: ATPase, T2SS/T4P/T4SS family, partial [Planctomycetota bacterium]
MSTMQIDRLLDTVILLSASDLHLTVGRKPTLRLHGGLKNLDTKVLESEDMVTLMKAITPERCQNELQEVGSCDFGMAFKDAGRFRVSVFRQRGDLAIVARRIPNTLLTFEQIGLPEMVRELIRRPRGMFLVTGPTGSGKTTSLATMIDYINTNFERHIITMEDPIEYYHYHK